MKFSVSDLVGSVVMVALCSMVVFLNYGRGVRGPLLIFSILFWSTIAGYCIFKEIERIKRQNSKEPLKDEFTKKVRIKASYYAFHASIWWWFSILCFIIYSKTTIPIYWLIGGGILGMQIIFIVSWFYTRFFGTINE